jgi:hypothetical protein
VLTRETRFLLVWRVVLAGRCRIGQSDEILLGSSTSGIEHGSYMVKVWQDSCTPGIQCIDMVVVVVVVVGKKTFAPSRDPNTQQDGH